VNPTKHLLGLQAKFATRTLRKNCRKVCTWNISVIKNIIKIVLNLAQAFKKFPRDSAESGWGVHETEGHHPKSE